MEDPKYIVLASVRKKLPLARLESIEAPIAIAKIEKEDKIKEDAQYLRDFSWGQDFNKDMALKNIPS